MANDNPTPNPNIAELGKETRFGGERANPSGRDLGVEPWCVVKATRRLAAQSIDLTKRNTAGDLQRKLVPNGGEVTIGQAIAVVRVAKALEGNYRFSQSVREDISGKLVEKKVEAQVTLEQLVSGSYEEPSENSEG
jgi:hypothetical protein